MKHLGRGKEEVEGRADVHEVVQHCFNFPSKRERKLSDEGQQEEAKRPKSPEREGVQLAEQHVSGGEGGGEMYREMRERLSVCMTEEMVDEYIQRQVQLDQMLGSAAAPTALQTRASPACHCAPALW